MEINFCFIRFLSFLRARTLFEKRDLSEAARGILNDECC
jgi:hypothetical protein